MFKLVLLESSDVSRALGSSVALVRLLVRTGQLQPVARTCRGVALFWAEDVELLRQAREAKRAARRQRERRGEKLSAGVKGGT